MIFDSGRCDEMTEQGYCHKTCGICTGDTIAVTPRSPDREGPQSLNQFDGTEASSLLIFKSRISDPSELSSWTGTNPCNGWVGISCKQGKVIEIMLGEVQWSWSDEEGKYVWTDSLYDNGKRTLVSNMGTSVPAEWSQLKMLKRIQLRETGLTGTLARELSLLQQLEVFSVDKNSIMGQLVPKFSNWKQMMVFDTSSNSLSGTLPIEYSIWSGLQWFDLDRNDYSGEFPSQYSTWNQIEYFDVQQNNFQGELPRSYSEWIKLRDFWVINNNLQGMLPPEYSCWTLVEEFVAYRNSFTGQVPREYSVMDIVYLFPQNVMGLCTPDKDLTNDESENDVCL